MAPKVMYRLKANTPTTVVLGSSMAWLLHLIPFGFISGLDSGPHFQSLYMFVNSSLLKTDTMIASLEGD